MNTKTCKQLAKDTNTSLRQPGYALIQIRRLADQFDAGLITYSEALNALKK